MDMQQRLTAMTLVVLMSSNDTVCPLKTLSGTETCQRACMQYIYNC